MNIAASQAILLRYASQSAKVFESMCTAMHFGFAALFVTDFRYAQSSVFQGLAVQ